MLPPSPEAILKRPSELRPFALKKSRTSYEVRLVELAMKLDQLGTLPSTPLT